MNTELAWAAGFYDGEGSTHVSSQHALHRQMFMKVSQSERSTLDRLCHAIGFGKVRGPYRKKNRRHSDYWTWQVTGRLDLGDVIKRLWPYLSMPKREQILRSIQDYISVAHPGVGAPNRSRAPRKSMRTSEELERRSVSMRRKWNEPGFRCMMREARRRGWVTRRANWPKNNQVGKV